jgi:hypothetical protein
MRRRAAAEAPVMSDRVQSGLRVWRRVQILAWASLIGIVGCFVVLVVMEHRLHDRGAGVRLALIASLVGYFASVLYLRIRKCPACGQRFAASSTKAAGALRDMSEDTCQNCGATFR